MGFLVHISFFCLAIATVLHESQSPSIVATASRSDRLEFCVRDFGIGFNDGERCKRATPIILNSEKLVKSHVASLKLHVNTRERSSLVFASSCESNHLMGSLDPNRHDWHGYMPRRLNIEMTDSESWSLAIGEV